MDGPQNTITFNNFSMDNVFSRISQQNYSHGEKHNFDRKPKRHFGARL